MYGQWWQRLWDPEASGLLLDITSVRKNIAGLSGLQKQQELAHKEAKTRGKYSWQTISKGPVATWWKLLSYIVSILNIVSNVILTEICLINLNHNSQTLKEIYVQIWQNTSCVPFTPFCWRIKLMWDLFFFLFTTKRI